LLDVPGTFCLFREFVFISGGRLEWLFWIEGFQRVGRSCAADNQWNSHGNEGMSQLCVERAPVGEKK
jgi:hypothetical protein